MSNAAGVSASVLRNIAIPLVAGICCSINTSSTDITQAFTTPTYRPYVAITRQGALTDCCKQLDMHFYSPTPSAIEIPKQIALNEIKHKSFCLKLKSQLVLDIYSDGKNFYVDYPDMNIYTVGKDINSVIEDFNEDFIFIWENYALEEDGSLTEDAQELKSQMLAMIKTGE